MCVPLCRVHATWVFFIIAVAFCLAGDNCVAVSREVDRIMGGLSWTAPLVALDVRRVYTSPFGVFHKNPTTQRYIFLPLGPLSNVVVVVAVVVAIPHQSFGCSNRPPDTKGQRRSFFLFPRWFFFVVANSEQLLCCLSTSGMQLHRQKKIVAPHMISIVVFRVVFCTFKPSFPRWIDVHPARLIQYMISTRTY